MTDNALIFGDNFYVMDQLLEKEGMENSIDLVYIDPPYGTNQNFTFSEERFSTISRMNGGKVAYEDTLTGKDYLEFLSARLRKIHRLLKRTGSIYLHVDYKTGHYVKVLMDEIFGEANYINEISRVKCNPKNFNRKAYGNIKDMILFYSKTKDFKWKDPKQEIEIPDDDPRFKSTDADGRKYTTTPLHAPGETSKGDTGKEWKGMRPPPGRHWRYSREQLDELDRKGLIEWSSTGNPRKKIYAEDVEKKGVKMQDIWTFKDPQNPRYPTEKNKELLRNIIQASSDEGDLVLDAFCGAGTTLLAAEELKRRYIGIDSSEQAISICQSRLKDPHLIDLEPDTSE